MPGYLRTHPAPPLADTVNNVERIELPNPKEGDRLTFSVFGRVIRHQLITAADAALPQRWAVLVAGHFNGTLKSPLNPLYTRPQRFTTVRHLHNHLATWLGSVVFLK